MKKTNKSMYDVLSAKKNLTPKDWDTIAEVALLSSQAVAAETIYNKEMDIARRIESTIVDMRALLKTTLDSAKTFKKGMDEDNKAATALAKKFANS
jgi:hypothetical protein